MKNRRNFIGLIILLASLASANVHASFLSDLFRSSELIFLSEGKVKRLARVIKNNAENLSHLMGTSDDVLHATVRKARQLSRNASRFFFQISKHYVDPNETRDEYRQLKRSFYRAKRAINHDDLSHSDEERADRMINRIGDAIHDLADHYDNHTNI